MPATQANACAFIKMKKCLVKLISLSAAAAVFAFAAMFCSCGDARGIHSSAKDLPQKFTREEDKIIDFAAGKTEGFYASHGYSNRQMFNCEWSRNNAVVQNGVMSMSVTEAEGGTQSGYDYYGAEYRSVEYFSYGFYSVCMKAADCPGVISSMFTYTGRPWDEIDIEILGKDMTEVQFNYYTNGKGGHEYLYKLPFDASEDFHEYAFDWQEDCITWYVDGTAIYRATEDIPSHPQQFMANVWNCIGHDGWSGKFDENALPATAQYKWFAYRAA